LVNSFFKKQFFAWIKKSITVSLVFLIKFV